MKLTGEMFSKKLPSTSGGKLILRDQLSQHKILLVFFPFAFEPNSVVNLTQLQARLEELQEFDYQPVGVCPENIFSLNFLALSLDIKFPLISDYNLKLSHELGLSMLGDSDYSPRICEAVVALNRDGEVEYFNCFEPGEEMMDITQLIENLPEERCGYCEEQ